MVAACPALREPSCLFGLDQYAYLKDRGARDALLAFVMRIIFAFLQRNVVVTYFADVSAAFDRVSSERLVEKLKGKGDWWSW